MKKLFTDKLKSEKPNIFLQLIFSEGPSFLDNREPELKGIFVDYINSFKSQISEVIRETDIKTLAENPNPQVRQLCINNYDGSYVALIILDYLLIILYTKIIKKYTS